MCIETSATDEVLSLRDSVHKSCVAALLQLGAREAIAHCHASQVFRA